jgi:hypothetical protein
MSRDKLVRTKLRGLKKRVDREPVRFEGQKFVESPLPEDTGMSHLKGIAFESPEVQLQKLRERLGKMSDAELIKFGKMVRGLSAPRVSVMPDPWKAQLEEARAEWRRGHPTG